jgi:hypothetical protein
LESIVAVIILSDTYQLELLVQNLGNFIVGSDTLVDNVGSQVAFGNGTQDLTSLFVNDGQLIESLLVSDVNTDEFCAKIKVLTCSAIIAIAFLQVQLGTMV